jgi:hypothetical protein
MKIEVLRSNELNTGHLTTLLLQKHKIKRWYIKTILFHPLYRGGKFFLKFIVWNIKKTYLLFKFSRQQ